MSKVLRTVAIIAGAVALIATGLGAAGVTAVAGVATAAVANYAMLAATTASLGSAVTAKPPGLAGSATSFTADPEASIPYLIGRTATRGNVIYRRTHNTAGYALPDLQTFGIVLGGGGPYQAIEYFSADNGAISFTGAGEALGSFSGWMWQTQQLGATPESASLKISTSRGYPPGWDAASKLSGYCAAMWTLRFDTKGKFYANGVPKPLWVVQGAMVYDPRLDSTYPGGSGACRAGNETTYVWSENPWLHALTWALGRYQNGKRVLGIGAPVAGIDVASFVEAANVAAANGWKVGGQILGGDDKWTVLRNMAAAGGGEVFPLGAQISALVNTPRVSLATVTLTDLAGKASAAGTKSRRDRFNTVIPRYRSEAHDWEMIPASAVTVSAYVTADGGERRREITWPLVQQLTQVQQLGRYAIENAREFEPVSLPLKLVWMGYKPGDVVTVTLPEIGLNGQTVLITNRSIDPSSGICTLTARSETNAKHAAALGQTGTAPPVPTLTSPPSAPQPGSGEWAISATGLVAGSSTTPALVVTGAVTGGTAVEAVAFEYRLYSAGLADDAGWIAAGVQPAGAVRCEITALLPGTAYQVAVRYQLAGLLGDRRIYGPATTAAVAVPWSGVAGSAGAPDSGATQAENLIQNADLTVDASGWTLADGVTRIAGGAGDPAAGVFSFPAAAGLAPRAISSRYRVSPGERVFAGVKAYRAGAVTATYFLAFFNFYDSAGSPVSGGFSWNVLPSASGAWQLFPIDGVVPAGAVSAEIAVQTEGGTGTVLVAAARGARSQAGADVTAAAQIDVTVPALASYAADFTGTIIGAVTDESVRVTRGGVSIKTADGTSYAITTTGPISATIDNTNGSATKGNIQGISLTGIDASIDVAVTVNGVAQAKRTIKFRREDAAPPAGGGSGAKTAYDTSLNGISATGDTVMSDPMMVTLASGETLYGSGSLSIEVAGTTSATRTMQTKYQYRPVGGGTWFDFVSGTYKSSGSAQSGYFSSGEWIDPAPASIDTAQSKSGLSAGDYDVQLVGKLNASGRTVNSYGTATVQARV